MEKIFEEIQEIKKEQKLMFKWIIAIGVITAFTLGLIFFR